MVLAAKFGAVTHRVSPLGPEVSCSPNASTQNWKNKTHTTAKVCILLGTHAHADSYTTMHTRDINTLGLIIMIRTEAQSTLCIITHFLQSPESRTKTPLQSN